MAIPLSIALVISYTVSAAVLAAASASISTPVRQCADTVARMRMDPSTGSAFTVTEWQHIGTHEWQMRIEMRVVSAWIQELATQHVYLLLIGATAWAGQCMQEAARREAFWQTVLLDKAHRELARKAEADVQQARVP